ncbi:hypothetical protein GCM10010449_10530 [Streptomyces rectiviolaceus]|uniref:Uncharacterized protein n=1 Tax=Streptomyces rectiviolaceus TaxID=332591 RepID=A0ABP6M8I2_9ACTN
MRGYVAAPYGAPTLLIKCTPQQGAAHAAAYEPITRREAGGMGEARLPGSAASATVTTTGSATPAAVGRAAPAG